jgi:phosphoesterase RecJ-like protein
MTFDLIRTMKIPMNAPIAQCLYTSIVFDTQLFRFIRKSPRSHQIAAELMQHEFDPTDIHRRLFANQTPSKLRFVAQSLTRIQYLKNNRLALLELYPEDFSSHQVDPESSRDVVDMMMNVQDVEIAIVMRFEALKTKISLRSKGRFEVLTLAEKWGGGGHLYAAGATIAPTSPDILKSDITKWLETIGVDSGESSF